MGFTINLALEPLKMADYYQYPSIFSENTVPNSVHKGVELGLRHATLIDLSKDG